MSLLAGLGIVGSIANGIIGSGRAKKQMRAARKEKNRLNAKLDSLESQRQDIVNPYADAEDLSGMISDLSANVSNPFANLGVATQAAEMQSEQADIALANTLDTIRATGSSAGGATALAQAALKSKQGVAASIEQQEKTNEDKRAAGEQQMEQRQMAEAQRLQQADVAGEQFMFSTLEGRQMQELDRTAAMLGASRQAEAQAQSDRTGAITGALGAVGGMVGAYYGSQGT